MERSGRIALLTAVGLGVAIAIASTTQWLKESQKTYNLRLATGSPIGEYYDFAKAIAQVTETHYPHINIEVLESPGSTQNMDDVQNKVVDMALVQSDTPVQPEVRAIAQLYPEMFHLIARTSAQINTMADLEGKRIALMPEGSGSYSLFWPVSKHYGLTPTDFSFLALPVREATDALLKGEVDALFRIIGVGNDSVADVLKTGDFELVPIDQIAALQLSQPYLQSTTIPKGTYDGREPIPGSDVATVSVSALLISHEDVDVEVVKILTQILYEYRNELISINPRTANIQPPDSVLNLGFPVHEGTKAYHSQDEPSFLVRYAEAIGLVLSLIILAASGLWQLRQWLIGRQKNRADHYNLEILELIEQVDHATTLVELQLIRQQLFGILKKVVIDLDIDRISPESFQSFTFPWEVAITTIRHQEMVVLNLAEGKPKPQSMTSITKIHR